MNEIVNGVVCCVVQYVDVELDMTGSISYLLVVPRCSLDADVDHEMIGSVADGRVVCSLLEYGMWCSNCFGCRVCIFLCWW
jgi:hypothetical protein